MQTVNLINSHILSIGIAEVTSFNLFVFQLNNRRQHDSKEMRHRIIGRVIEDLSDTDIFTPLYKMSSDDGFESESELIACENDLIREKRIKDLQDHYNVEGVSDEVLEQERILASRCGKTDLHEAVSARDAESVRRILEEGNADLDVKDNNGYTAAHAAVVEGYGEIVELFKDKGLLT